MKPGARFPGHSPALGHRDVTGEIGNRRAPTRMGICRFSSSAWRVSASQVAWILTKARFPSAQGSSGPSASPARAHLGSPPAPRPDPDAKPPLRRPPERTPPPRRLPTASLCARGGGEEEGGTGGVDEDEVDGPDAVLQVGGGGEAAGHVAAHL